MLLQNVLLMGTEKLMETSPLKIKHQSLTFWLGKKKKNFTLGMVIQTCGDVCQRDIHTYNCPSTISDNGNLN